MDAPTDVGLGPSAGGPPPPSSPPGGPGPRRLRRRPDEGHIAGVCAGVAEYFNVDPVIVRIAAVVLAFSGPGVGAYILAWIFVPEAHGPVPHGQPQSPIDRKDRGTQIFGIVLLALAVSVIWGDWWSPARRWLFPIGLMALGAWLLLRRDRDDEDPAVPPVPPVPPTPAWTGAGGATATTVVAGEREATPDAADPADPDATAELDEPDATDADAASVFADPSATTLAEGGGAGDGDPPRAPWDVPPLPVPPAPPGTPEPPRHHHHHRRRRFVSRMVLGALLIWAALAWLGGVSVETGLAFGLLIVGVGFVLGSFMGGTRGLIFPALVIGTALALTAMVDIPLSGPVGDQRWAPQRLADLEDRYEVSIGEGTLDLTSLQLAGDDQVRIDASVGIGHLEVIVPADAVVEVDSEVGMGESRVLGLEQNGVGVDATQRDDGSGGTIELDLQVGLGQVEVSRGLADAPDPEPTTTSTTRELG